MKSYYKHLATTQSYGHELELNKKPIFRSSAIFPVIRNEHYTSRITFLGYWLLKRQISEVSLLITLRDKNGFILKRNNLIINTAKVFNLELDSMLDGIKNNNGSNNLFKGSIELEVFSSRDMVFPYPAFVLNYYNEEFSTSVHTVGRIYNDVEDWVENENVKVPESGFDIYSGPDLKSFIAFTNGPLVNNDAIIDFTIVNQESKKITGNINLGKINPYETIFLQFDEYIKDLTKILDGKSGTIKISHNFEGFFPRFLAGNIQYSFPSVSFTHTFYDCSSCSSESDYWNRKSSEYNDSSILIPLFIDNDAYTDLILYPNFSPSVLLYSFDFYNNDGKQIGKTSDFVEIDSKEQKIFKFDFKKIVKENELTDDVRLVNIIANSKSNKIPTRLKLGLNVGISGRKSKLPCNICFAPKLGDPIMDLKPGTFRWSPILNVEQSVLVITNGSPLKRYTKEADIKLNFFRQKDNEIIEKIIRISPFGQHKIDLESDRQLKAFLDEDVGWLTIKTDNPNVGGWYFEFHSSGAVAGDHFF